MADVTAEVEARFADRLDDELPVVVRDVAEMLAPGTWDQMAPEAQQMVITQIRTEGRQVAQDVFQDLQGISHELLDLERLVFDLLSGPNVKRLVRLFQEIGGKELKAIVRFEPGLNAMCARGRGVRTNHKNRPCKGRS